MWQLDTCHRPRLQILSIQDGKMASVCECVIHHGEDPAIIFITASRPRAEYGLLCKLVWSSIPYIHLGFLLLKHSVCSQACGHADLHSNLYMQGTRLMHQLGPANSKRACLYQEQKQTRVPKRRVLCSILATACLCCCLYPDRLPLYIGALTYRCMQQQRCSNDNR